MMQYDADDGNRVYLASAISCEVVGGRAGGGITPHLHRVSSMAANSFARSAAIASEDPLPAPNRNYSAKFVRPAGMSCGAAPTSE